MPSTRKGQQRYFCMKAHIAVDVESGLVQTVTATAAPMADISEAIDLLGGKEQINSRRRIPMPAT